MSSPEDSLVYPFLITDMAFDLGSWEPLDLMVLRECQSTGNLRPTLSLMLKEYRRLGVALKR